jgi:hypothetical protein
MSFPWIFIGVAAIVDLMGLFYLWRRRNSGVTVKHRADLAERRRKERRGTGRVVAR